MKTEYKKPERVIITASSKLAPRKAKVFNPKTQMYDIDTILGAEDPKTGKIWCEDLVVMERNEDGRLVKTYGKWLDKEFIRPL